MPSLSRSELAAYAACAVLVALLGWRALRHDTGAQAAAGQPASAQAPDAAAPSPGGGGVTVEAAGAQPAVVHVVGAVRRPGVYRLRTDERVQDAIRRAGGASSHADLQAINLAAKLADAQQVVVPRRGAAAAAAAVPGAPATAGAAGPASPVNLNTATTDQLDTLDGVGPATAQKIIAFRTEHGGFRSIDDLGQIAGIGPKKLEALRTQVQV